jgi:hypothetical protein
MQHRLHDERRRSAIGVRLEQTGEPGGRWRAAASPS